MRIASFAHKGLKKLYLEDNARGVPPEAVDKLRKMFAWLDNMEAPGELLSLPAWKPHVLKGDRHHTWSLSVSRNRRLTFRIDISEEQIVDLNLEDYH